MSLKLFIISFAVCCISSFGLNSQISYYNTYTGNNFDVGQGIVQLPEGKLAVTGSSSSLKGEGNQAFIMVIDSLGNHEWTKPYGGANSDWGRRVFHEEGVGFWVAGYSNSYNENGDFDFVLLSMDEEGELLEVKTYGTEDWERLWDAIRLRDGGFFLVGEKSGTNALKEDMFMVRTNDVGDTLWTKTWQTTGEDVAYATVQLNDSTLLVAGKALNEDEEQRASLFAFNLEGELYWEKYYGENVESSMFFDISYTEQNVFLAGGLVDKQTGDIGNWVLRVDISGNINSEQTFARQGNDYASTILALDGNRLYWTLYSESPEDNVYPGGADLFLLRFNWGIFFEWSRSFSAFDPDIAHQIIPTGDGGFAIVGEVSDKRTELSFGKHILVIKVGPNDEMTLVRNQGNDLVSLTTAENDLGVNIYPNPVKEKLYIEGLNSLYEVEIRAISGKLLYQGEISSEVDVTHLKSGVYFLSIKGKYDVISRHKFLKY